MSAAFASPLTTNALIPAVSGLVGVAIGGWATALNQGRERKTARIKQQLSEFYSPLIGIRSQIKAKSDVRLKVTSAAHEIWSGKFRGIDDPFMKKGISDHEGPAFEKLFDYNNNQILDEIIPLYRKMLDTFTEKMWLAEPSTIAEYSALVEFVELWNRFLDKSLPGELVDKIGHKEEHLAPFYADLEKHFAQLSKRLK